MVLDFDFKPLRGSDLHVESRPDGVTYSFCRISSGLRFVPGLYNFAARPDNSFSAHHSAPPVSPEPLERETHLNSGA